MIPFINRTPTWKTWITLGFSVVISLFFFSWLISLLLVNSNIETEFHQHETDTAAHSLSYSLSKCDSAQQIGVLLENAIDTDRFTISIRNAQSHPIRATQENTSAFTDPYLFSSPITFRQNEKVKVLTLGVPPVALAQLSTHDGIFYITATPKAKTQTLPFISICLPQLGILFTIMILASLIALFCYQRSVRLVNRAVRVKTQYIADASHELKTPIAGIKLLAETIPRLAAAQKTDQVCDLAEKIDAETDKLETLVADVIALSQTDGTPSTKQNLNMEQAKPVNFNKTVAQSFRSRKIIAEGKGIDLNLIDKCPSGSLCLVNSPLPSIATITNNLLDNAIKFTEKGSVTGIITKSEKTVSLEVIDTGIGISKKDQALVFERFYQTDKNHPIFGKGTGLGLAIAYEISQSLGGNITLRSTPNKGSHFKVTLPLLDHK
ncbi:MAG: HAMP domain-containing sensor histidine kinase [Eggerthellaceae bacterium]